jgi:hypothetical protein
MFEYFLFRLFLYGGMGWGVNEFCKWKARKR